MSADDNLSQQLFHGTDATLQVGDTVRPRKGEGSHAFATDSPDEAAYYANFANNRFRLDRPKQPESTVYTVEPLDTPTVNERGIRMVDNDAKVMSSKTGFKVTGIHSKVPFGDLKISRWR